jgi:hypothetical protein
MKSMLRVFFCAAAGWLAGEVIARTLLAPESVSEGRGGAKSNSPARDSDHNPVRRADDEWREFLAKQQVTARQGIRTADLITMCASTGGSPLIKCAGPDVRLDLTRALAGASKDDFPKLLEAVVMIRDARVRRQIAGVFFAAWAEHDPRAAMEAADKVPGLSMAGLNGALKTWAEKDPRELIEWLKSPDTFGWAKMQAETNAFVYLVESDPQRAMQLAAEFDEAGGREARDTVFKNWHRRDPAAADQWMATAPDHERREVFQAWIMSRMGNDPGAAWEAALTQHPDRSKIPQFLPAVFYAWQGRDAPAARGALLRVPAEIWQPSFATQIGDMLGQKQATSFEAIAAKIPEAARASFWAGAANGALNRRRDPTDAAAALAHLPEDNEDRIDLAGRIAKDWLKSDPTAASEWVRNLPAGLSRDFAAASLAEGLVLTDPEAAALWAADIRNERIRTGVQKRIGR